MICLLHSYDEGHTRPIYFPAHRVVSVEPAPPYGFEDVRCVVTLDGPRVVHVTEAVDEVMRQLNKSGWIS